MIRELFIPIWCEVALLERFLLCFQKSFWFPGGKMGITPVNPEQACPLPERLFSTEPTVVVSSIAATRTIPFLSSECLLELDELSPVRQGPFEVWAFILQTTCEDHHNFLRCSETTCKKTHTLEFKTATVLLSYTYFVLNWWGIQKQRIQNLYTFQLFPFSWLNLINHRI